jgi:hypothetical protein
MCTVPLPLCGYPVAVNKYVMEFNLALKGLRSMKFQKIMLIDMEHDFAVTKRIFQLKQL